MKGERGQITIEAILIFGMFIIVLVGISYPLAFRVKATADDVAIISDARYATEQIGTSADSVVTPDSKRTIKVYVPGFKSTGNTTTNRPLIHIATRICTNGTDLITTILIARREPDGGYRRLETHNLSRKLMGANWTLGTNVIVEDIGKWYDIVVKWKNITSNTSNSPTGIDCSTNMATPPAEF